MSGYNFSSFFDLFLRELVVDTKPHSTGGELGLKSHGCEHFRRSRAASAVASRARGETDFNSVDVIVTELRNHCRTVHSSDRKI